MSESHLTSNNDRSISPMSSTGSSEAMSSAGSGDHYRVQNHGVALDAGRNRRVRCNYCAKVVTSFSRLQHHLGHLGPDVTPCLHVPGDVMAHMRSDLMERKKGKLVSEVGEVLHPQLPLKRNFVPANPEPSRSQPSSSKTSVSAAVLTTKIKLEDVIDCHANVTNPSLFKSEDAGKLPKKEEGPESAVVLTTKIKLEDMIDCHGNVTNPSLFKSEDVGKLPKKEEGPESAVVLTTKIKLEDVIDCHANVTNPSLFKSRDAGKLPKKEEAPELRAAKCIGRFFFESGLELTGIKLASFQKMIDAFIGCGVGYKPPVYDDLTGRLLREEVVEVRERVKNIKSTWERTGCTILFDSWTDHKGRILMGFLVDCPQGAVFLRSVDASDTVYDVDALLLLFSSVIEEVGHQNVVQIMANETSCYIEAVKKMLLEKYSTIFWTTCADTCINMILEKIGMGKTVEKVLNQAKAITRFVYSHTTTLKLMKEHIRGGGLVKASKLKSVAQFITLHNMVHERENLMLMFSSPAWNASILASKTLSKPITDLVKNSSFWAAAEDVVKITDPLIDVLHKMNGGTASPMGLLYDTMDQAKEKIRSNFDRLESKYMPYWDMIDDIWNNDLHNPIHSAGYYLNPGLFYSSDFYVDAEVTNGLLICIVRMVEDQPTQERIVRQLDEYRDAKGRFSDPMAIAGRTTESSVLWWSWHAASCPELQDLAIKILSQPCTSACRYNLRKGLSEQLHAKGGNCIEQQNLRDMEFVNNNLHLWNSSSNVNQWDCTSLEDIGLQNDWIVEI